MNILEYVLYAIKILFLIWANIYSLSYGIYEFKRNKVSFLGVLCLIFVGDILLLI